MTSKPIHNESVPEPRSTTQPGPQLGDIGYTFVKIFPGYGNFRGTVIAIRKGAKNNKSRRCQYTDGDEEDLSIKDLQALEYDTNKRSKGRRQRMDKEKRHFEKEQMGYTDENDETQDSLNPKAKAENEVLTKDIPVDVMAQAIHFLEEKTLKNHHELIVSMQDKDSCLTDFTYHALKNFKLTTVHKEGGRGNNIKTTLSGIDLRRLQCKSTDLRGLQCIHCPRKFFFLNFDNFFNHFSIIPAHALNCRSGPEDVKNALQTLKYEHAAQRASLPNPQKMYVLKLWDILSPDSKQKQQSSSVIQQRQRQQRQQQKKSKDLDSAKDDSLPIKTSDTVVASFSLSYISSAINVNLEHNLHVDICKPCNETSPLVSIPKPRLPSKSIAASTTSNFRTTPRYVHDIKLQKTLAYLEQEESKFESVFKVSDIRVVGADKKHLLTDYFFHLMKQLHFSKFEITDRNNNNVNRKRMPVGLVGLMCLHCAQSQKPRKFFFANLVALERHFCNLSYHLFKCKYIPQQTMESLVYLRGIHKQQMKYLIKGSQKLFYYHLWNKFQIPGLMAEFNIQQFRSEVLNALRRHDKQSKEENKSQQKQNGIVISIDVGYSAPETKVDVSGYCSSFAVATSRDRPSNNLKLYSSIAIKSPQKAGQNNEEVLISDALPKIPVMQNIRTRGVTKTLFESSKRNEEERNTNLYQKDKDSSNSLIKNHSTLQNPMENDKLDVITHHPAPNELLPSQITCIAQISQKKSIIETGDIGDVGYRFTKLFPNHGMFNGEVVQIVPGTDKDGEDMLNRRCIYTDGDMEDVSLKELKRLANIYPQSVTEELTKKDAKLYKSKFLKNVIKKDKPNHSVKQKVDPNVDWRDLDYAEVFDPEYIPCIDVAAETTLMVCENKKSKKRLSNNDEYSDEEWLTDLATGLLVSSKPSKTQRKRSNEEDKKNDEEKYTPLADIKRGERHGCKVVNTKPDENGKHIVGEIIVEQQCGWVEIFEGNEVRKRRVGDYVVVPKDYSVGKEIASIQLSFSDSTEISSLSETENAVSSQSIQNQIEYRVPLDSIFYWKCDQCSVTNFFLQNNCQNCNMDRSKSPPSALLKIIEEAAQNANNCEEALKNVPMNQRDSIPPKIMSALIRKNSCGERGINGVRSKDLYNVAHYFYWNCGFCTMKNSFKVQKCKCCSQKKNDLAEVSVLLQIASQAAGTAKTYDEAMSKLAPLHVPAVSVGVIKALVTCIATVKDGRRCLRPKINGFDYCSSHIDAFSANPTNKKIGRQLKRKHDESIACDAPTKSKKKRKRFKSITSFIDDVSNFFKTVSPHVKNLLRWDIQNVEDAFCSERNVPFALGLTVRRYFPGYGFHDGRIADVERQIINNEAGNERPVLVYRVEYNDGDCEDLLHHEINSLRCMYNYMNIKSTSPPNEQIPKGSRFETSSGTVEILNVLVCIENYADNGRVQAKFWTKNQTEFAVVNLELTKLQLTVAQKKASDPQKAASKPSPSIDWPTCIPSNHNNNSQKEEDGSDTKDKFILSEPHMTISKSAHTFHCYPLDGALESALKRCPAPCGRKGAIQSGWDPTGGFEYMVWDPYDQTHCEKCKQGDKERFILICDECNLGFHTFCLRPVVSAIPTSEWLCPYCSSEETGREGFEIKVKELMSNFPQVSAFMSLPFKNENEIGDRLETVTNFLQSTIPMGTRFVSFGYGKKKTLTTEVGGIHLNRRNCKHLWLLPVPRLHPNQSCHSFATMAAAMKYCGVMKYSEELVYAEGVSEDMNDASMDVIEHISQQNLEVFLKYKENLKNGVYPPVEVVYDDDLGFTVRALFNLPRHTILTEYVGEVTTIEKCQESVSDSLMILLDTGDHNTSLIIDPTRISNIARFLSGVNNRNFMSRRKANVRTRRFIVDGKCRVVLYAARHIKEGESLNYDYNAGNEGKSMKDILRTGFYDTSNFL